MSDALIVSPIQNTVLVEGRDLVVLLPSVNPIAVSVQVPKTIAIVINQGVRGDPGTSQGKCLEVLDPGQTVWTLSKVPVNPELSEFYLNGQKQRFLHDYLINGQILIWQTLTLSTTDYLEINYSCP